MEAHSYTGAPADRPRLESLPVQPLLTAEFDADPGAVYDRLRRTHGPVAPVGLMGVPVWLVLDYREVLEVLKHENQWRRDVRYWRARAEGRLPHDWRELGGMIVTTAVGRVFDHFTKAELTLPPDQLPWRAGPVVRGLRLLPVRYELSGRVRPSVPGSREEPVAVDAGRGDSQVRGLLSALRRLMFGNR
ncbi:cytochrome P450 [Streptomyces gilvus]|uniref:cytochrome P450 n=1 Tax=Streptomyces gilvus TaxID=2920937 RepID=UPI001F111255|nr:cytochrome P450 [Streptomyces sp. CME 23]MCH5677727.1 cytochrome P450 [Streptomyces sp. CME 23]